METEDGEDPFVCNGCLCDLVDFRFKCLSCPDFDLCEDCQSLDRIIGDHDPKLHYAIKLSTKPERLSSTYTNYAEGSIEDLTETLAVLDAFQCFRFDVQAMSAFLRIPVACIRQILDRMIEREVNHTKGGNSTDLSLSGHAESEEDSSPASSLFLEICDADDLAPESRPFVAQEIDGLNKVGSIWISVARLGVANLEAAHEMLIAEDASILTRANVGHSLCAIKRCYDIANCRALQRHLVVRNRFISVTCAAVQGLNQKNCLARRRLKDAMKVRTPDMRRILSDIFKYIQISWLDKGSSSRVGSTTSKAVRIKAKRQDRSLQQILDKPTRTVTPEEMRIPADLRCLTKIYHRHLFDTPVKKTAFSLVRKFATVSSTTLSDGIFANNVLDEICACDEINDSDQDFAAGISVVAVDKIDDPSLSINSKVMKNPHLQEATVDHLLVPVNSMTNAVLRDSNFSQFSPVISDSDGYLMLGAKCKSLSSAVPLSNLFRIPVLKHFFSLQPEQKRNVETSAISFETKSDAQLQNAHEISQRTTVTKIDTTKVIAGTNDESARKEIAVRKFISAALGSAGSASFIGDDTLPRRPFSFGKVRPHKLVRLLGCNNMCIQSTIHAVEDTFIASIATTSDFIPSTSGRMTPDSAQLLSNECDYAQSSDEIPSTDCSFRARSQAQEDCVLSDPFVKTSLDISRLESYYRPSFLNDTADVIGDNLIVITSEKLNSSEMLMLNDDTSIFLLRHYKSFWTGLTSNDERNFYKPTRPSTNAVGGHSNTHEPNPMNVPQHESQPVCTSKIDDIRRDAFTSDITREMIAQTEFSASSAIVPYCEPLIRSLLRLDLTRSTEVLALFSTEMAYQSHESNQHFAMIQNNFDSLSQNSVRSFVERNRKVMSPHNVDFGRKETFNLTSPIFVNHLFEHCDDQMTMPSMTMALVPFEGAPSCDTDTADSVVESTINSTENTDEQSTAPSMTMALVPFEGAPSCETGTADSVVESTTNSTQNIDEQSTTLSMTMALVPFKGATSRETGTADSVTAGIVDSTTNSTINSIESTDEQSTTLSMTMALVPFEGAPSRETGTADSVTADVVDLTIYSTTYSTINSIESTDEQSTAPSMTMALVPFEGAPSREIDTADSIAAGVVDSTTNSTTNSDRDGCDEKSTMIIGAPSMTIGLELFGGAPSRETDTAHSINTSDCWSPSAKTFQSADDTIVSPSLNHSWAPFLIESTSIIDEIPNKSTKRLRQRRFVSNHGKNGEASRKYRAQSNIEAINESANDKVVVVKCETVPFFEVDSTPLSWFVDLSATNAMNAADAASPIWTGRNSIKVKKEASWFDDDLTSINSTNHEVDCFSPEIDNSFNIQKLEDSSIQNTNSKTNYLDGCSDQNVTNRGPIKRQKGLIKSILKRAQTSPEVVTDQATPGGGTKSSRLDEDELDGQTRSFKRVKFADGTKAGKLNARECTNGYVSQIKPTMSTSTQLSLLRRPTLDDVVIKTMTTTQDCTHTSKETSLLVDQMATEREGSEAPYSSDNVVISSVSVDNYLVGCRMPATIVNDSSYPEILPITTATDTQGYIDSINEQSVAEINIIEHRVDAVSTSMIKCYEDVTDGIIVGSEYDKHRDNDSTIGDNDDIFLEEDVLCYSSEVMFPRFQHIIDESTATRSVTGHYRSSVHSTVPPSTSTRNSGTYDKSLESISQQHPVIHAVINIGGTGDRLELKDAPHKVQMPNASLPNNQLTDDNDDSKPLKLKSSGSSRGYSKVIDKMHRVFGSSSLEKFRRRKKLEDIIKVKPDEGSFNQAMCSNENSRENSTTDRCDQSADSTGIELAREDKVMWRQPDDDELSRRLNIITLKDREVMTNNPNKGSAKDNDNVNRDDDEEDIEDESSERTTLGCSDLTWDLLNEDDDEDDEDDSLFEDSPTDFSYHRTMTISNMLRLDDTTTSEDPTELLKPQADR